MFQEKKQSDVQYNEHNSLPTSHSQFFPSPSDQRSDVKIVGIFFEPSGG